MARTLLGTRDSVKLLKDLLEAGRSNFVSKCRVLSQQKDYHEILRVLLLAFFALRCIHLCLSIIFDIPLVYKVQAAI